MPPPPPTTLLISLGNSPAVVPEAFLLPDTRFTAVHVLTSETCAADLVVEFFRQHAPDVPLSLTRVAGFTDLTSDQDHFNFEEVLYRWMIASEPDPNRRFVCLSGGYKTMSAAMQRAATLLGAAEVFHVLAQPVHRNASGEPQLPSTPEQVLNARDQGALHWIRLGPEPGWPQFTRTQPTDFPLQILDAAADGTCRVSAPDHRFREGVTETLRRSQAIAGAWDSLADLPFPELATWSALALDWLRQPLQPDSDADWIRSLPKVELHCHLGGFATHGPDLDAVRGPSGSGSHLPPLLDRPQPAGWPLPSVPCDLGSYMRLGDNNGSRLLRNPECLERQCRRLYRRLVEDRVTYAEIRCSPANYRSPERSALDVLNIIRTAFQSCMEEAREGSGTPACHVNLIVIATRKDGGDRSDISRHLALAITAADQWRDPKSCRVVGVDLAGFEDRTTRAALFETDFEPVHRVGLAVTVHAGENDDAEGIWQAVFKLDARRIGHALHLGQAPDLLKAVADRGIGIEMCPYANVQIRGFAPVNGSTPYPLADYLRKGVQVTVNTDNIGISQASLSDNLLLLARLCPDLTRLDVLRLQRNALNVAFIPAAERQEMISRLAVEIPRP